MKRRHTFSFSNVYKTIKISLIFSFIGILSLMVLNACSASPDNEIRDFVQTTKQEKAEKIEPLPNFPKFEPYKYTSARYKSPFEMPNSAKAQKPLAVKKTGPAPDMNRPKEALESFALDSLHMVGTIERGGTFWALIRDPHGVVHRVGVGNHLGENYGKIEKIGEKSIQIREWVSDDEGGFRERNTTLRLSQ